METLILQVQQVSNSQSNERMYTVTPIVIPDWSAITELERIYKGNVNQVCSFLSMMNGVTIIFRYIDSYERLDFISTIKEMRRKDGH